MGYLPLNSSECDTCKDLLFLATNIETITVIMQSTEVHSEGFKSDPDYPPTDIELQIEGKSIHLNKVVLKSHSPVFRTMLESDFKEKDTDRLELEGKKYEDFIEFLQAFYPNSSHSVTRKCMLGRFNAGNPDTDHIDPRLRIAHVIKHP
jgi:hypothetical protein